MRNGYLSEGTARDIDSRVARVLRGLGSPEPPLVIEDVVELLKLDRKFYSSGDDSVLREHYSRIKVGVLQVFKRPSLLLDVVKQCDLRAFYVPDRKRILIDQDRVPTLKVRWTTAHEITHEICMDWHGDVLFGDSEATLSEACHQQIEREANYGAGRLLTLQKDFKEFFPQESLCISNIQKLSKTFKNTLVSTLWRAVEHSDRPAFALVGRHPQHSPAEACKYYIRSQCFEQQFGTVDESKVVECIRQYCGWSKIGKLGVQRIKLTDDRGDERMFLFETFASPYDVMTLAKQVEA